jgi:precorrin-3B C17-methyltransferase
MSLKAHEVIKQSEVIVGYKTYLALIVDLTAGKTVISTGMTQEVERVKIAIDLAQKGKKVSLVSSGDPGVYGMAGLALELIGQNGKGNIKIKVIPGVTAATSCASILGAPLMHDFAVISLSNLLTDMKLIEKRIKLAAEADLVIVFYNPQSKKRTDPLRRAWKILLEHKPGATPVGIVRNAGRENLKAVITTLEKMLSVEKIDMLTTVIIGNSKTYLKDNYLITPRGYKLDKKTNYHL